ncbi:F0F1 ATP synthase subunit I [Legionella massiliensis]|uniref:F0F1 ATP synthase subunit I n=1 Tax=Legionella massiliensis TaxID=1034943 RepID=A0A078KP66_9GAMM|nr:F0F1 ATP synthase subunit I [Legionella massiliensis]CDZ76180.1 F0F1 ATP synthase subunit I [Legionella massiliensis]CEE11918.1 F0F1 ATP synthase subunit I [Legionella massiliensis]
MGENVKDRLGVAGVKRLLKTQLITSVFISLVFFLFFGKNEGISAMLGGLVALVPSILFAKKMFRYQGARAARQIVKSFYIGEALKISSTAILFTLVFVMYKIAPLAFFFTYIVVLMNYWFAPLIFANKQNRPESD